MISYTWQFVQFKSPFFFLLCTSHSIHNLSIEHTDSSRSKTKIPRRTLLSNLFKTTESVSTSLFPLDHLHSVFLVIHSFIRFPTIPSHSMHPYMRLFLLSFSNPLDRKKEADDFSIQNEVWFSKRRHRYREEFHVLISFHPIR